MRVYKSFSFWLPLSLFIIHQVLQKGEIYNITFFDNYLDPFCLGALVPYALLIQNQILFKRHKLRLNELGILTLFLCFVSEYLFPIISNQFTRDWLDCCSIFMGALWFFFFSKRVDSNY